MIPLPLPGEIFPNLEGPHERDALAISRDLFGELPKLKDVPIKRGAEFSDDGKYRYTLTREWGEDFHILWIGCNPSLADTRRDDPTIMREMNFSRAWGFGRMTKVNLYPIITPDMRLCNEWLKTLATDEEAYAALMVNEGTICSERGYGRAPSGGLVRPPPSCRGNEAAGPERR